MTNEIINAPKIKSPIADRYSISELVNRMNEEIAEYALGKLNKYWNSTTTSMPLIGKNCFKNDCSS